MFPRIAGPRLLESSSERTPRATFAGSDAQLDAAIKYLQDEIQKDPRPVPPTPPYPVKAFKFDQ